MNLKLLKILIFILILFFYGSLLVHKINLPAANDLPRQIKIGETILQGNFNIFYKNTYSYTEPDQTFFNHHWLSGVVFYLLNTIIGFGGLVIFKVIVLLTAFTLLFLTATKKANFWLVALFSIPTILILAERTDVRPEMFSYLFIAVYLYFLIDFEEHPERKMIFWLIPLQLLWVNMHIFFSIGIMMVAGFWLEKIILNRKNIKGNPLVKKLTLLLIVLAIVSFINPRGAEGVFYRYPGNFPVSINENQSLSDFVKTNSTWEDVSITIFKPMILLLAASFIFGFRQKPIFYFLAGAATAVLGFIIIRSITMFGMVFLPAVSANFNEVFEKLKGWLKKESSRIANITKGAFIVCLAAALGYLIFIFGPREIMKYEEPGIGLTHRSSGSVAFFKEQGLNGPIFNNANSGSYLIYYLYPQEKVFADNRFADAYSAPFFNDVYFPMLTSEFKWQEMLAKYNFNTIFFFHYWADNNERIFLNRRMNDPTWSLVYADNYNVILVKNSPENQSIIKKFQITKENAAEKLAYLLKSPNADDEIAAADLFNIIGRQDLALAQYFNVVTTWPQRNRIWMIMGEMESSKNDPTDLVLALMFLDKAITEGGKTAEAYSFIGLAYYKLNQFEKAKEALREALKIDPKREDAQELISNIEKFKIQ